MWIAAPLPRPGPESEYDRGGGWDLSIAASWAIGPSWSRQQGSGVSFPSLWSKQAHYWQPVMHRGSGGAPGPGTQPTAKLPWHRATFNGHTSIWRRERGGTESPARCTLSKRLQRGERNRLFLALFILCSCSQSIRGSKEEMSAVSQSSPTHQRLSRHLVHPDWQQTDRGDKTPRPTPQETSLSGGDNHSTCQGLIWTTRTQTLRRIFEGWCAAAKQAPKSTLWNLMLLFWIPDGADFLVMYIL